MQEEVTEPSTPISVESDLRIAADLHAMRGRPRDFVAAYLQLSPEVRVSLYSTMLPATYVRCLTDLEERAAPEALDCLSTMLQTHPPFRTFARQFPPLQTWLRRQRQLAKGWRAKWNIYRLQRSVH